MSETIYLNICMNINICVVAVEYLIFQCSILLFGYSYQVLIAGDCCVHLTCIHMYVTLGDLS
jgi:hypothetical protein